MRPHPRSKKRYWRDRRRHEKREAALNFLARAIFDLFPASSWKDELPLFPGVSTFHKGVIWGHDVFPGSENSPIVLGGSIKPPPGPFGTNMGIGILDTFMIHIPTDPRSYMRERLLEEECQRHFPLADAASRAAYVAHSIKMADRRIIIPDGMDLMRGFNEPYPPENPTTMVKDAETGVIYYPAYLYGMIRIWAADIDDYVYTTPNAKP